MDEIEDDDTVPSWDNPKMRKGKLPDAPPRGQRYNPDYKRKRDRRSLRDHRRHSDSSRGKWNGE